MKEINIYFALLLALVSLVGLSCNNEDDCMTGTVRFINTSDNPYNLYIDDQFQLRIEGNSSEVLDLLEGESKGRVEQVSGFVLFPTILERNLVVFGCQEEEWVFP